MKTQQWLPKRQANEEGRDGGCKWDLDSLIVWSSIEKYWRKGREGAGKSKL
jgi:hypothetical protein